MNLQIEISRNGLEARNAPDLQFADGNGGQDLIHGQGGKMAKNARREKSRTGLDNVLEDHPKSALFELEQRVIQLEKDVDILKQLTNWPLFNKEVPTDEKKKPGVKEKIDDGELFNYRDGLIRWLEAYWPWLEDRLVGAASPEEVGA